MLKSLSLILLATIIIGCEDVHNTRIKYKNAEIYTSDILLGKRIDVIMNLGCTTKGEELGYTGPTYYDNKIHTCYFIVNNEIIGDSVKIGVNAETGALKF